MRLSLIVPCFNEEKKIAQNLELFNTYLAAQSFGYEIIVINDSSTDQTLAVIKKVAQGNKQIRVISHPKNQGKGASVRSGLLAAQGEYAVFLDADSATSIDHIELIWPYFEQDYDLIIGSRNPKDVVSARIVVPQAAWKQILGKSGNLFIRLFMGVNIHDTQCGFKAFSRAAIQKIIPLCRINRWAFDVEIIVLAKRLKLSITIVPIKWENQPRSQVKIAGYFTTLLELCKIKYFLLAGKYKK